MSERYTVHRVEGGHDEIAGHFTVQNGSIYFDSMTDEFNCGIFPAGPISPMTERRLQNLLNNMNKSVYITRG